MHRDRRSEDEQLRSRYRLTPVEAAEMAGPAQEFAIEDGQGRIGIITPLSSHFCNSCNRIRITASGLASQIGG